MASIMKPARPPAEAPPSSSNAAGLNPRTQRMMAGMEHILRQASGRSALQDVSNQNLSPRLKKGQPIVEADDEKPTAVRYALPRAPGGLPNKVASGTDGIPSSRSRSSPAVGSSNRCMSPNSALQRHSSLLSSYERQEILGFEEVYFVGETTARKIQATPSLTSSNNFGYDDEHGDYKVINDDHIGYRYQILSELGRGSFGQVSKAIDHKTKQLVALKVIKNKKKFHDQALIEVELLKHLRDHDPSDKHNVVKLIDSFIFRNHMCIIFELHGMNLYELCKANRFAPMNIPVIKHFAKQLLNTLQYLYSQRIVHCDMKPENILLKAGSKSTVKVIDFGSSCFENQRLYTYIQSRFYRAPEVMLGIPYTSAIDMWSFGCILAELANGYPIFPGESESEQLCCLMEFLGVPPRALVERGSRKKNFFDANGMPKLPPNSRGRIRRPATKELGTFLRVSSANINDPEGAAFVDFVSKCFTWDPSQRWTPLQAMQHPWISGANAASGSSANVETSAISQNQTALSARTGVTNAVNPSSPRVILPLIPQTSRRV